MKKQEHLIDAIWAGTVDYGAAWDWQKSLVAERRESPDLHSKLLLLEHPPTYTLGRSGQMENLLLDEQTLARRGIALHRVDRGGDITYHGPGQLVGYPILYLKKVYPDYGLGRVRRYVQDLEEVIIKVLANFEIAGQRLDGHRGVWVDTPKGLSKMAAIGVRIGASGVSSHGFALNVNPNLDDFSGIIPCGIQEYGVTSMTAVLQRPVDIAELLPHVLTAFAAVFQIEVDTEKIMLPMASAREF